MFTVVNGDSNWKHIGGDGDYPKGLSKKLSEDVVDVMTFMKFAEDFRDIRAYPGFGTRKHGERKGHYEIKLDEKWSIVFRINKSTNPNTINVVCIDKGRYSK